MKKGTSKRHQEPSAASLREMPEVDFSRGRARRNPYAARIAKEGFTVHIARGRPRKGQESGPTTPRSIRFPDAIWAQLEQRAKAEGIPLHAALRAAVLEWLNHGPTGAR